MLKNKFIFNWGISKNPNKKIIKIKKGIKMLFIFKMLEIFFLKIKKQNKQINMQVIILERILPVTGHLLLNLHPSMD